MRRLLLATVFFMGAAVSLALPAAADTRFEARLAGHAILPAFTMAVPPADAPRDALVSGKFAGPGNLRIDRPGAVMGDTGPMHGSRPTGIAFPFIGQPVQGFSGIKPVAGEPGAYWLLTDNGFGNRRNSPDALLMFHKLRPDFRTGQVAIEQTTFLSDPHRRIPFRIAYEGTERRYLTGADFDLESIQPVEGGFWFGDSSVDFTTGGHAHHGAHSDHPGHAVHGDTPGYDGGVDFGSGDAGGDSGGADSCGGDGGGDGGGGGD